MLNEITLEAAITDFFSKRTRWAPKCPSGATLYQISIQYPNEPYWVRSLREQRFGYSVENGIFFQPDTVKEILEAIESVLNSPMDKGVMLKGPQGIGKSHSLVNTVLALESTGKYLVTFVPNCEKWNNPGQLVDWICSSFGSSMTELGLPDDVYASDRSVEKFITEIDGILEKNGKRWVFVFDQIEKLFAKPVNTSALDASGLSFPYCCIHTVMKARRITSVISGSANNEMAYNENHEGFTEYCHRINLSPQELCKAFPKSIDKRNVDGIMELTNGVPLYALQAAKHPENFQSDLVESVQLSLHRLKRRSDESEWSSILESINSCVFQTTSRRAFHDRKFLLQAKKKSGLYSYQALTPTVVTAYRQLLNIPEKSSQIPPSGQYTHRVARADSLTDDESYSDGIDESSPEEPVTATGPKTGSVVRGAAISKNPEKIPGGKDGCGGIVEACANICIGSNDVVKTGTVIANGNLDADNTNTQTEETDEMKKLPPQKSAAGNDPEAGATTKGEATCANPEEKFEGKADGCNGLDNDGNNAESDDASVAEEGDSPKESAAEEMEAAKQAMLQFAKEGNSLASKLNNKLASAGVEEEEESIIEEIIESDDEEEVSELLQKAKREFIIFSRSMDSLEQIIDEDDERTDFLKAAKADFMNFSKGLDVKFPKSKSGGNR